MKSRLFAGLVVLLLVIPGTVLVFRLLVSWDRGSEPLTQEELERKQGELLRIASIEDSRTRSEKVKKFIADNPGVQFLPVAYSLLLDSVAATSPKAARELADEALTRFAGPAGRPDVRFAAYEFKLNAFHRAADLLSAAALARQILAQEEDPELLRFASRFDPGRRDRYERKISEVMRQARESAESERMAGLLDLLPGQWEKKEEVEKTRHLTSLIDQLEQQAANEPRDDRLNALYRLHIARLVEAGDGAQALHYLDRLSSHRPEDAWTAFARGSALESRGELAQALMSYIRSFALKTDQSTWERIRRLGERQGEPATKQAEGIRQEILAKSRKFPPFNLKTPEGEPRTLADFKGKAVLINFFFPG